MCRQLSLSYKVINGPSLDPPLLMAHGMMGNKSNFNHVAKKLNMETGRKVNKVLGLFMGSQNYLT